LGILDASRLLSSDQSLLDVIILHFILLHYLLVLSNNLRKFLLFEVGVVLDADIYDVWEGLFGTFCERSLLIPHRPSYFSLILLAQLIRRSHILLSDLLIHGSIFEEVERARLIICTAIFQDAL